MRQITLLKTLLEVIFKLLYLLFVAGLILLLSVWCFNLYVMEPDRVLKWYSIRRGVNKSTVLDALGRPTCWRKSGGLLVAHYASSEECKDLAFNSHGVVIGRKTHAPSLNWDTAEGWISRWEKIEPGWRKSKALWMLGPPRSWEPRGGLTVAHYPRLGSCYDIVFKHGKVVRMGLHR